MSLILIANPGSASRKYALYDQTLKERARLHFEMINEHTIACTLLRNGTTKDIPITIEHLADSASQVVPILSREGILTAEQAIDRIGLRIVAPRTFFMQHRIIDRAVTEELERAHELAPLHIEATIGELKYLKEYFPDAMIVGASDSAFHATKPDYAWNYGINLHDADTHDIKRFGYHGLSVEASIDSLRRIGKLTPKIVVCHLGSGASVSAVLNGRSVDTTMGFTPLEGLIMSTRVGSIDPGAVYALSRALNFSHEQVEQYLHTQSGLLGLGGSSDIRELIAREANGNHIAHLALATLVHSIHKAIGQMIATLNGIDLLVFTGTVGERSYQLRPRITAHLGFVDMFVDTSVNDACTAPTTPTLISSLTGSKPIFVIPTDESQEIAKIVARLTK